MGKRKLRSPDGGEMQTAWMTAGIQVLICLVALIRFSNPRWALGWLVGVIALLDGLGFLIRDPQLLWRPNVDAGNSGFLKEYMAAQILIGITVLFALATRGVGVADDRHRSGLLAILPSSDAIVATLGSLLFGILCFATGFHILSAITHPDISAGQQVLYAVTDTFLAVLIVLSLLKLARLRRGELASRRTIESRS